MTIERRITEKVKFLENVDNGMNIHLIDKHRLVLKVLKNYLTESGHDVKTSSSAREAVVQNSRKKPRSADVVIIDPGPRRERVKKAL